MRAFEILRQTSEVTGETELDHMGVPDEAREVFAQAMGQYIIKGAPGLWYPPEDNVEGHQPDRLAVTIGQRLHNLCSFYNAAKTGSPIEDRMAAAMLWLEMEWAGFPQADIVGGPQDHLELWGPRDDLCFYLTPQCPIGKWRVDFLVWFAIGRHIGGVVVECDGHQFHEKNKEQAARDKRRDRELLAAGYPVMRFTGSEIFKDAVGCAEQLRQPLYEILNRVSRDGGLFNA